MDFELFEVALKNMKRAGIRTFLTLIGVVIGIAAIVSLLSIGEGLNVAIEKQFQSLGSNTIFIIPGNGQSSVATISLTDSDISRIESVPGVDHAIPIYVAAAIMEYQGEKVNVQVNAVDPQKANDFADTGFFELKEGRELEKNDSTAILVGNSIAKTYFSREIGIKKKVLLNEKKFEIAGILKPQAQTFGGGPDQGSTIYMTLDAFKKISSSTSPSIVFAKTRTSKDAKMIADKIKELLEKKYGKKSVFVSSSEQLLEQVNQLFSLITIFLAGIAGISLIVGGVGIMNAMVTSVLERTKEIGLLKALGASDNRILFLFLIESAFIGGVGGAIGTLLGFGLSGIIAFVGVQAGFGLTAVISAPIAIMGIGFSMVVGMISGFYPSLRASKLDPVVALRYE